MKIHQPVTVLGIETSCDETATAVVRGHPDGPREVLAEVTLSQIREHRDFGGVVPEIAARAHIAYLDGLIEQALHQSGVAPSELDAIAVTAGPGLIGGVIVGLSTAKALAFGLSKPLVAVNHLEGHALTARLSDAVEFPFLLLLVSGGHAQILAVDGVGSYRRMGTTLDDAVGEAFDKAAKLLDFGYPGGPEVERRALRGDPRRFDLPRPMVGKAGYDFSFSGLKTALRQAAEAAGPLTDQDSADLAASFQAAVADCLCDRLGRAMTTFAEARGLAPDRRRLVVAGGVAANRYLRARLTDTARQAGFSLTAPPIRWCTDNAVMIAWAGIERLVLGLTDSMYVKARARWPLDETAGPVAHNRAQAAAMERANTAGAGLGGLRPKPD